MSADTVVLVIVVGLLLICAYYTGKAAGMQEEADRRDGYL